MEGISSEISKVIEGIKLDYRRKLSHGFFEKFSRENKVYGTENKGILKFPLTFTKLQSL